MDIVRPKKIHYCWFGGNSKPAIINKCIESWKKYMPEYEIIEWNEYNYDVDKIAWTREAYQEKKWAFVSDYARFDVIDQYGGIYLDTDVELLKRIPDEILAIPNFTSFESAGKVNPGLIYADIPNGNITEEFLRKYESMHFLTDNKPVLITVNTITTDILKPQGLVLNNQKQEINGLTVFPSNYFCGYDMDVHEYAVCSETISVHHYAGSWAKKSWKRKLELGIKKIFGIEKYRKILYAYRKVKNGKIEY